MKFFNVGMKFHNDGKKFHNDGKKSHKDIGMKSHNGGMKSHNNMGGNLIMAPFWAYLKKILTTLYGILPGSNFKLFLREAELRYNIREKGKDEIISLLSDIFKLIYEKNKFNFNINDLN